MRDGSRLLRLRFLGIVVALVATGALAAAGAEAAPVGAISGRVLNESTGEPQRGVRIILNGADEDGSNRIRRHTTTDARGRYGFAGLATGNDRYYTIDARYRGGLFAGGAVAIPDNTSEPPVIETTIKVWETTTDPRSILIRRDDIFAIASAGSGIGIIEAVTFVNHDDHAYIGRAARARRHEATPSLAFALPEGADRGGIAIVESDLDIPRIVPTDAGFAATIAIPPGEFRATFSYSLPDDGGTADLSRVALYPTLELNLLAAPPLEVRSNRLEPREEVTIGTGDDRRDYRKWSTSDALDAGDPLQAIVVVDAGAGPATYAGIAAALVVGLGLLAAVTRRIVTRRPPKPEPADKTSREQTLTSIAELDLRHDAGQISDAEWASRRASLKARVPNDRA